MAKKRTAKPSDKSVAAQAIRQITGCGVLESRRRVSQLEPELIERIAIAEREGKRDQIAGLISASK